MNGDSAAFLDCAGLVKRFGAVAAVNGADLAIARGHVLALLGPSGCGKTTLLRLIAGFETPDGGAIRLAGRVLSGPGAFVLPEKRRVAIVFQDFALFPHLNVGANIAFGLPKGVDKKRRVGELLDLVSLHGLEQRMPHQLSGGQQQRVALARALAAEPDLLLLDEPFSNLDPSVRAHVRAEVKQLLHTIGITALVVTHDQEEALSLAEEVAVMIEGRIHQVGTPADVYARPVDRAVAEFVGEANFLRGNAHDSYVDFELGRVAVTSDFAGPADVMVRAENLVLDEGGGAPGEVVSIDYYGHDQMATIRLASGSIIRVRLSAERHLSIGEQVAARLRGEVFAFQSTEDRSPDGELPKALA